MIALRRGWNVLPKRRSWRVLAVLAIAALAWGGYLWLRDASVLRVRNVEVSGLNGPEAPAIRRALESAAGRMTVLHVREDELERAVDSFPVVRSLSASASFPSTLRIRVAAYQPVAALTSADGRRVAVAEGGIMLRGVGPQARLPTVRVDSIASSRVLRGGVAAKLVEALAHAPASLIPQIDRAYAAKDGIRIELREGPLLELGRPARLAAKWAAATRVLADPGAAGADVIDVRLPERPAISVRDEDGGDAGPTDPAAGGQAAAVSPAGAAPGATGAAGATGIGGPTDVAGATGAAGSTGSGGVTQQPGVTQP